MTKLSTDSLDWALNHALSEGDTDIFPPVFEYEAIKADWQAVRQHLASRDVQNWVSRPLRRALSPKGRYGFRIATQLDPLDFLVFTALVYELGPTLEASRVETDVATSYRYEPAETGRLYDPKANFASFQHRSRLLAHQFPYVVVTDIADFFPRLYHHRIEGMLESFTDSRGQAQGLLRLLHQWTQRQSYGIPVGPSACRLIAETSITDVDRTLLSEGITFIRYVDDYRIFATSPSHAYQQLVTLANSLFSSHGLTLQQEKTWILNSEEFQRRYCGTEDSTEINNLAERFDSFLKEIGVGGPYEEIDYADLDETQREMVNSLNLAELLRQQLSEPEVDQKMTRFLLRRLGQLGDASAASDILGSLDSFFTVLPDVINYFKRLAWPSEEARHDVGQKFLTLLSGSDVSKLEFHKAWIFDLFGVGEDWGINEQLVGLYPRTPDDISQRELILALAKARQDYWFRNRKDRVASLGPWEKRAFLAGASCLPSDEHENWYRSQKQQIDVLERAVVSWATANPL